MSTRTQTSTALLRRDLVPLATASTAVGCFAVHAVMLVAAGTQMLTLTVPTLVLSGLCLTCTWREGRAPGRKPHLVTAATGLAMIVLHLVLMPSGTGSMAPRGGHAGMDMSTNARHMAGSASGVLPSGAVDVLMEVGIALAVALVVLTVGAAFRPTPRSLA